MICTVLFQTVKVTGAESRLPIKTASHQLRDCMPVITPGELRGCIFFAFYVNVVMLIAENHICLHVCMLLLSICEVVCTSVFCDMHAF